MYLIPQVGEQPIILKGTSSSVFSGPEHRLLLAKRGYLCPDLCHA